MGWVKQFWVVPHSRMINNAGKLSHTQSWRGSFLQQLLGTPYDKDLPTKLGQAVVKTLIKTDEHRQLLRYAAKFGLGIKWGLFDGGMNAYINKSYAI